MAISAADGIQRSPLLTPAAAPAGAAGTLSATYSTTSTTAVSSAFGVSFQASTTSVRLIGMATITNNTATDGVTLTLYRSTAAIPAAGAAPGGSDVALYAITRTISVASNPDAIPILIVDSGRTVGSTYYYYLALAAVTGGTASLVSGTNATTLTADAVA